jgi:formate dehydrogenase iron-sulfur subunit
VARALESEATRRGRGVRIVRNGSRGLYWLEPLVEVVTPGGRVAYGPVHAAQVPKLLDGGLLDGAPHELRLGDMGAHPWLVSQQRLTAARLGIVDPASVDDYLAHGGYQGLDAALAMAPADIVRTVTESGLRGPRRCRVPDRHQVADGARPAGRAQIHRLQRRRGRLRHVLRSHADGG